MCRDPADDLDDPALPEGHADFQLAAAQRRVRYRWRTRHWAVKPHTAALDPKATWTLQESLQCILSDEPHSTGRRCLL
jgi:hypothetical protein